MSSTSNVKCDLCMDPSDICEQWHRDPGHDSKKSCENCHNNQSIIHVRYYGKVFCSDCIKREKRQRQPRRTPVTEQT